MADVREETEQAMCSSLIDLIRGNAELSDEDMLRRAYRVGSDLSRGAVALCAEITTDRAHYVMTLIADRKPQALAERSHPSALSRAYSNGRSRRPSLCSTFCSRRRAMPARRWTRTPTGCSCTLASHPDEVMRFYEDTVAPIVVCDEQYGTDLVGTLESYLAHTAT